MAKIISYKFQSGEELIAVSIKCKTQADYNANYFVAEKEAIGEISVEGEFDIELIEEPSQLDRIESQVAYLAMMTGNEDILEV